MNKMKSEHKTNRLWILWGITIVLMVVLILLTSDRFKEWYGQVAANPSSGTTTPAPTPTLTPSPSPTPTLTPSPSPTPTITPTLTPSPSPTPTLTPSPSPTPEGMLTAPPKREIDTSKPMLAFTFDDGPDPENTKAIMDIFEQHNSRASFFVVGYQLDSYGEFTQEAYQRGFMVGNHTMNHPVLSWIEAEEAMKEINQLNDKLNELGIPGQVILRPPYGEYTEYIQENLSVPMIGWDIDTEDWKSHDTDTVCERIIGKVKDGDIILMHDIEDCNVEAVRRLVPMLIEEGYELVTITEMFEAKGIVPESGRYYRFLRPGTPMK